MSAASQGDSGQTRRLLLVVGIGRSGTSLFAGILRHLGFAVPQPELEADDTNPQGFHEPGWVVDFHTRIMRARRVTVFDSRPTAWSTLAEAADDEAIFEDLRSWLAVQFVGSDDVVVKDPRIGWFLPLWRRCAEALGVQVAYATMVRHPAEVVRSARESYGTWQRDASRAAAWLNVTLHTEAATRGERRAFVRYDRLLADWASEIARVAPLLDAPSLARLERAAHPKVEAFVDPRLRRSVGGWEDVGVPAALREQLDRVWELVSALAEPGGDTAAGQAAFDEARTAYVAFYEEAEAIAQSTATAVKPRKRRAGVDPRRSRERPRRLQRPSRVGPPARRGRSSAARAVRGAVLGLALRIPPRYRERVPLPVVRAGFWALRAIRR